MDGGVRATLQSSLAICPEPVPFGDGYNVYFGSDGNTFINRISSGAYADYNLPPAYTSPYGTSSSLLSVSQRGNIIGNYGPYPPTLAFRVVDNGGFGYLYYDAGWNTLYDGALVQGSFYGPYASYTVFLRRIVDSVELGSMTFIIQE